MFEVQIYVQSVAQNLRKPVYGRIKIKEVEKNRIKMSIFGFEITFTNLQIIKIDKICENGFLEIKKILFCEEKRIFDIESFFKQTTGKNIVDFKALKNYSLKNQNAKLPKKLLKTYVPEINRRTNPIDIDNQNNISSIKKTIKIQNKNVSVSTKSDLLETFTNINYLENSKKEKWEKEENCELNSPLIESSNNKNGHENVQEIPLDSFFDVFNKSLNDDPYQVSNGLKILPQIIKIDSSPKMNNSFDFSLNNNSKTSKKIKGINKSQVDLPLICPICFTSDMTERSIISECGHNYCSFCLQEWAKIENKCPLCKVTFNEFDNYYETKKLNNIKVSHHKQVYKHLETSEDLIVHNADNFCYVCDSNEKDYFLLICDFCLKKCCHSFCLNPKLDFVPQDKWFCDFCVQKHKLEHKNPVAGIFKSKPTKIKNLLNPKRKMIRETLSMSCFGDSEMKNTVTQKLNQSFKSRDFLF